MRPAKVSGRVCLGLDEHVREAVGPGGVAHEGGDVMAAARVFGAEEAPEIAGRTGDEDMHDVSPFRRSEKGHAERGDGHRGEDGRPESPLRGGRGSRRWRGG